MSVSEIIISFIVSLITSILSGAIIAKKGDPERPTIIQFRERTVYREKVIIKERKTSRSDSSNDMWGFFIICLAVLGFAVTFLAKYRDVIILWGLYIILIGSSVVIASIIVSVIREKRLEFAGIWTFLSWIAIIYVFWRFTNPGLGQNYFDFLSSVKQGKSVDIFNDYSMYAFYQLLGLLPLTAASVFTFIQSITFALWPIAFKNRLLSKSSIFYDKYFLGLHAFLILLSFIYCSGVLIKFSSFNGNILK